MVMRLKLLLRTIGAAALVATAATAATNPTEPARRGEHCFLSNSWQGWSAPGGGDMLYLRVNTRDVYRVDLTPGTHARKGPENFLVSQVRGSNWICSPLDLDLTLSDHHGFREPLIARTLRKLTAAEIAAIPRRDLP